MASSEMELPSQELKLAVAPADVNATLDPTANAAVSTSKALHATALESNPVDVNDVEQQNLQLPEGLEQPVESAFGHPVKKEGDEIMVLPPRPGTSETSKETVSAATTIARPARNMQVATQAQPKYIDTPLPVHEVPESLDKEVGEPSTSSPLTPGITAAVSMPRSVVKPAIDPEIRAEPEKPTSPAAVETAAGDSPALPAVAADSVGLKELPKVAAEAAIQAGHAYVEAGKQAQLTIKDLLSLREKEGPPVTLTVDQIATAAFFLLAGLQLLILPVFLPSTFRLLYSLVWGLLAGLGLSFVFYRNKKKKSEANELMATNLGLKGVQTVVGGVPAVFNVSDTEKMEWLNALVLEMWPFVDKAVCNMIKEITAQMVPGILQTLPGVLSNTVKNVGFKHLTFGAVPFRVETIHVHREQHDGLVLELSVKWCGDPNITLAIELATGQKLCPRVLDITFAATVRVLLQPLVPRLPGFVALMATVPKPPLIKYRLDFGRALGGSALPRMVTPVIDFFLKGTLDRMLVWPNRIVLPILQERPQDGAEVQKLMRRVRGMVRICVVRGKQLKGLGPIDNAVVELTADSDHFESTPPRSAVTLEEWQAADRKVDRLANTEIVTWEHYIYLLVQEPESQMLRLEAFGVSDGRTGGGGGSGSSREDGRRIGRALVKLAAACKGGRDSSIEPVPVRVNLGENDWGSPGGPGKGAGTILLHMSYFSCEDFTKEQVLEANKGIITVRLLAIGGLSAGVTGNVAAYASYNLTSQKKAGRPSCKTTRRTWTLEGHVAQLKAQLRRLELAREVAQRQGDVKGVEAKEAELQALREEIDTAAAKSKTGGITLDYSMDTLSSASFYNVTERLEAEEREGGEGGEEGGEAGGEESGQEENMLIIKVVQEGLKVKRTAETLGVAEVPMSCIKNSRCINPLSGKAEFGLYLPKWRNYDPEVPGAQPPESEWGLPLSGSAGGRVWFVARWVPCVEAAPGALNGEGGDDFIREPPSAVKTVQ